MYRHMDADLTAMLENKVPPVPLDCISAFNTACAKFEKKADLVCIIFSYFEMRRS